jgi:3-phenylpropionate/cinnamic acid dioxygenase small subunit
MPQDADLAERLAVQDVMVTYASSIDDRDFDTYRRLFHSEVEFEGFGSEPIRGVDAWLKFVEKQLEPYRQTQHLLGPPRVQVDGDRAHMRTDLQAMHFKREPKGQIVWLWGAYRTEVAREAGVWTIRKHQLDVWGTRSG